MGSVSRPHARKGRPSWRLFGRLRSSRLGAYRQPAGLSPTASPPPNPFSLATVASRGFRPDANVNVMGTVLYSVLCLSQPSTEHKMTNPKRLRLKRRAAAAEMPESRAPRLIVPIKNTSLYDYRRGFHRRRLVRGIPFQNPATCPQ